MSFLKNGSVVSKWALFSLMSSPTAPVVQTEYGRGIVQGIEREDGSGKSFNLKVLVDRVVMSVYVRTAD